MEKTRLAIIGSGPAGYTAAIYAARARLEPIVFTGVESGGQLMYTSDLENFPGFPDGVIGPKFMFGLRQQAEKFGAKLMDTHVTAIDFSQRPFKIWTKTPEGVDFEVLKRADAKKIAAISAEVKKTEPDCVADAVVVATGATAIMLGLPNEMELLGKGVSTCAVCDAAFYRDKNVFVVGGGDSAMEDTLALTKFASSVTMVHRRDSFRASKIMQERVLNHPKVTVLWNAAVTKVVGEQKITHLEITQEGKTTTHAVDGLFLAIGHRPVTALFANSLALSAHGYITTRVSLNTEGLAAATLAVSPEGLVGYPSMTSVEGVFAGGDVVDVRYKQAITAAGQGCMAALDAERWLESQTL